MIALRHIRLALAGLVLAGPACAAPRERLAVERVVIVMRHGIRAPLEGEVPDETRTGAPWPTWLVAESRITPHGARALAIVGADDRARLDQVGLLRRGSCPTSDDVRIHTNSSDRTISSGGDYARGFAPGCKLLIDHLARGAIDPMFEPLRARATAFDAAAAILAINRDTGGMAALVERHRAALQMLDRVLGCRPAARGCLPPAPIGLTASADGHDLALTGPVRSASGIAQVLLLQFVEGMPAAKVGWGRADAATLQRPGALHAALFAVFTHSSYMAAHQAAVLGRETLRILNARGGPRTEILMGHDTNVTALAAALRIELQAPGYGTNDVPPGGALVLESLRDADTGRSFVRVSYRTQEPVALRTLGRAVTVKPMRIPECGATLCPAERFTSILESRLAPLARTAELAD